MKTKSQILKMVLFSAGTALIASSCSSMSSSESGDKITATGPTIMNARTTPTTVELNRDLQPLQKAEVMADVKDFNSKVTDVRLKFKNIPIQIPMQHIQGTTWRAQITQRQLQMLAVSGKTIKYDASIIARDERGMTGESASNISVAIKAPDLSRNSTG